MKYRTIQYLLKPNNQQKKLIDENIKLKNKFVELYKTDIANNRNLPKRVVDVVDLYFYENEELTNCNKSALINAAFKIAENTNELNNDTKYGFTISYSEYCIKNKHLKDKTLYINKIGDIRYVKHLEISTDGILKSITVKKDATNKYYALCKIEFDDFEIKRKLNKENTIGLDYSLSNFLVDNDGNKYNLPFFYEEKEEMLNKLNKKIDNAVDGSVNKKKLVLDKRRIHKNIANRRRDYLHKLSRKFINEYDYICLETLDMVELAQKNNYGKRVKDQSFAMFVKMLEYKAEDCGKKIIKVPKWYPSSKLCSYCGSKNENLKINDRVWICPNCKKEIQRDQNAAINIKNKGLEILKN